MLRLDGGQFVWNNKHLKELRLPGGTSVLDKKESLLAGLSRFVWRCGRLGERGGGGAGKRRGRVDWRVAFVRVLTLLCHRFQTARDQDRSRERGGGGGEAGGGGGGRGRGGKRQRDLENGRQRQWDA